MLTREFKNSKSIGRSAIQRTDFIQLLSSIPTRKPSDYDASQAQAFYQKLKKAVGGEQGVEGLIKAFSGCVYREGDDFIHLRNFKNCIYYFQLQDGAVHAGGLRIPPDLLIQEIENFAQYLDKNDDGFIDLGNLRLVEKRTYQSAIVEQ